MYSDHEIAHIQGFPSSNVATRKYARAKHILTSTSPGKNFRENDKSKRCSH